MASSSSSNPPPPAERVAEIIEKLPSHPSLITKTGTAILCSGLLAAAISQELYVFNEESQEIVIAVCQVSPISSLVPSPYHVN
jgi:F-type H+-transporting ATPase subunit b